MNDKNFLGVELPIIQAPMAGVQDSVLAAAVSIAGGLGSLPTAAFTDDALRSELSQLKAQTDKPFNLNFFCHSFSEMNMQREHRWRAELKPYYEEFGLCLEDAPAGAGLTSFGRRSLEIVQTYLPKVVSFHFGLPSDDLIIKVKACGAKILASATTLEEALWLEAHGVDAIIAQGIQAGGHRGMFLSTELSSQSGTFELLPAVLQEVDVPVIAAGGIANPKDVATALSMGASAVQVGTAYLLCPEAKTSPIHREALSSEAVHLTAVTNVFSGRPARSIINRVVAEIGPINPHTPTFPYAGSALLPLRKKAEENGLNDFTPLWCGAGGSQCQNLSAGELTRQLANG